MVFFSERQLAVDMSAKSRAANEDGAAFVAARRRKETSRLVVLAATETQAFVSQLAKVRSREEIPLMQCRVEQAWRLQWCSVLVCSLRGFASSFKESGNLFSVFLEKL